MRGFLQVLCIVVAVAVTGCMSSTQVAMTAGSSDDGPGCYNISLANFTTQLPDYLSFQEDDEGAFSFVFRGEGEEDLGDDVASHNRVRIDFWVARPEYDLEYWLNDHVRARDELAMLASDFEVSAVRETQFNDRMMYTYNLSHRSSFDDGRLMRGRYALFALESGQVYVTVTGIWEATRHEEMSGAFNTIAATMDVEVVDIRSRPCEEEDEEEE